MTGVRRFFGSRGFTFPANVPFGMIVAGPSTPLVLIFGGVGALGMSARPLMYATMKAEAEGGEGMRGRSVGEVWRICNSRVYGIGLGAWVQVVNLPHSTGSMELTRHRVSMSRLYVLYIYT